MHSYNLALAISPFTTELSYNIWWNVYVFCPALVPGQSHSFDKYWLSLSMC